ncbi:hypothetical protein ACJX0J_008222, partial [Zea mays]
SKKVVAMFIGNDTFTFAEQAVGIRRESTAATSNKKRDKTSETQTFELQHVLLRLTEEERLQIKPSQVQLWDDQMMHCTSLYDDDDPCSHVFYRLLIDISILSVV